MLVPAEGIWSEPDPTSAPTCSRMTWWMEITNCSTGTPQEVVLINWPGLCCSVSVILSISCDRVQERRPSLERVPELHGKHVV